MYQEWIHIGESLLKSTCSQQARGDQGPQKAAAALALPALLKFLTELAAAWKRAPDTRHSSRQPGNCILITAWQQIALTVLQMLQVIGKLLDMCTLIMTKDRESLPILQPS